MRISILIEGRTEQAFKPHLLRFLRDRLPQGMPHLNFFRCDGRVYKGEKLRRTVADLLTKRPAYDAVIALTDVYTGTNDFIDAADAKRRMIEWVGREARFHPHAAQHDFEAWLLPFWDDIKILAGHNKAAPSGPPELVNHNNPPSAHIREIFRIGKCRDDYSKVRDANRILHGKNLAVAAASCPELKSFLNTILRLGGGPMLPAG